MEVAIDTLSKLKAMSPSPADVRALPKMAWEIATLLVLADAPKGVMVSNSPSWKTTPIPSPPLPAEDEALPSMATDSARLPSLAVNPWIDPSSTISPSPEPLPARADALPW